MKNIIKDKLVIILISFTIILAIDFLIYYTINSNIRNYKYTDKEEYESVEKGIRFIEKLPTYFNIINQSFHNINSLKQEYKEAIAIAYYLKNSVVNDCDDNENEICIYESDLKNNNIFKIFNTNVSFSSKKLNLYVDGFGPQTLYKEEKNKKVFYRLNLKEEQNVYQIYSSFKSFKKEKDKYNFYIYQGYYNKNSNSQYELHDLIHDEVVYTQKINKDLFEDITNEEISKLQLYKYILKKDKNGEYYLYGYNPVKSE